MVVGLVVWELQLPGCRSLKEKRSVLKSIKDRMHDRFNISVAETARQDVHQRAELAACVVSGDRAHVDSILTTLDRFMEAEARVRIVDSYRVQY